MLCVKLRHVLLGLVASLTLLSTSAAYAQTVDCTATPSDPSCSATATITATVLSKVSPSLSSVVTDLIELPADGTSSVLITVTAINHDGSIADNREIFISSNRGSVDLFSVYVGNNLQAGSSGFTDANGVIRFTARSLAPGQATFTVRAENVNLNDRPTVTFTPLPIISNIVVSVTVPTLPGRPKKKITIFEPTQPKPAVPTPTPSPSEPSADKLVNTQIELRIPFWIFILIGFLLLATPIIFIWITVLLRRVRLLLAAEKSGKAKEESLLNQIFRLEQQLAQNQQYEIQQTTALKEQIAESNTEIKQSLEEGINTLSQER